MESKTKGAWLIHHASKLRRFENSIEFENILTAGKTAQLLSALSETEQISLGNDQVDAIRKAVGVSKTELPAMMTLMQSAGLVSAGAAGVSVLGVTSHSVPEHAARLYDAIGPSPAEDAALAFAEITSNTPLEYDTAAERLSDEFKLTAQRAGECINQSESFGFVDAENVSEKRKLYFNGNIFRRSSAKKVDAVLSSLTNDDSRLLIELNARLSKKGCMTLDAVKHHLGDVLFSKLHAAGFFDVNEVANDEEKVLYVTRPAAFSKFGDPFADDILDLAKAFVTCLTYGMTRRDSSEGRIQFIRALLRKLINGQEVGPATAIGQDYHVLEYKRVIKLRHSHGQQYYMRLLKRDVGEMALEVLTTGEAIDTTVATLYGHSMVAYSAPEETRTLHRRSQTPKSKHGMLDILTALRMGK